MDELHRELDRIERDIAKLVPSHVAGTEVAIRSIREDLEWAWQKMEKMGDELVPSMKKKFFKRLASMDIVLENIGDGCGNKNKQEQKIARQNKCLQDQSKNLQKEIRKATEAADTDRIPHLNYQLEKTKEAYPVKMEMDLFYRLQSPEESVPLIWSAYHGKSPPTKDEAKAERVKDALGPNSNRSKLIPVKTGAISWEALTITFLGEREILIQVHNKELSANRRFDEAGFADGRNGSPVQSWHALIEVSKKQSLPYNMDIRKKVEKIAQGIRAKLRALFPDIKGDPFPLYNRDSHYRPSFIIVPPND